MDVREKLVELMCESPLGSKTFEQQYYKSTITKIADYLIAHGVTVIPPEGIGEMSDGYHTFNELYHHRAVLFSVICNAMPDKAWKSKRHDTGDMYDGMFIVGIETNHGQATYHYDVDPYWDMFNVPELEYAPKWDGHTPQEAINRIANGVTGQDSKVVEIDQFKLPIDDAILILREEHKQMVDGYTTHLSYGGKGDPAEEVHIDALEMAIAALEWEKKQMPQPPKGE